MATTKKRAQTKPAAPAKRYDGWQNSAAGFGVLGRDKVQAGIYTPDTPLTAQTLAAMYYGEDLAATIVDKHVTEAFRKGYDLTSEDPKLAKEFQDYLKDLDFETNVINAFKWGRLFGGCLLILGAEDGQEMDQPLNENRIKSIPWIVTVDARYAVPRKYYEKLGPKFGKVESYEIRNPGNENVSFVVHESRCVRFGGVPVDPHRSRTLRGWDQSVLQRPFEVLRQFGTAMQGLGIMLSDASQGVFKIKNLIDTLASNQTAGLHERLMLLDYQRSTARSAVLDASEDFSKVATSFTGVPEVVDRLMQRLSAATGIPVSIMMGRSAAGMNATGDLDIDSWHAEVAAFQTNTAQPIIERLVEIFSLAKDAPTRGKISDIEVKWNPLRVKSEKEIAEVRKLVADTYAVYVSMAALDPAQVAIAVFGRGGGEWSDAAPEIDVDELQKELDAQAEFEDPEPTPAPPATPAIAPVATAPALPAPVTGGDAA